MKKKLEVMKKLTIEPEKEPIKQNQNGGCSCQFCGKKLRSRYQLNIHLAVHTGEKNFICGICKKGYQQKWNLITHVARVHSKEKPFKCNECGKAFGYSSHFKRHVKTHFLEKIDASDAVKRIILNPHKCNYCEKSFESNYRLILHVRTHTGTRPYVCDKCGHRFTTKHMCEVHMRRRHQGDEYVCEHCGKLFSDCKRMTRHIQIWHEELPEPRRKQSIEFKKQLIPCEVCGKNITRTTMNKHLNIHYRNRLYSCRYCKKEFPESGQRMVHERKHTGEKPYVCDICGRGHTQYGNLLTHRRKYHNLVGSTPQLWKRNRRSSAARNVDPEPEPVSKVPEEENQNNKEENQKNEEGNQKIEEENQKNEKNQITEEESQKNEEENQKIEEERIPEPPKHVTEAPEVPKPECTGNETIQEFLKKASNWVNEKFKESKHKKVPEREKEDSPELSEEDNPDSPESREEEPAKEETKTFPPKEIKKKLNNLIFDKIVEDLLSSPEKETVQQVLDSIKKNSDVLREFLKKMKKVPDNTVMKTKDGTLYWHCWMCDSKLKSRHLLVRHLIIHEPEENRPYRCDVCNKTFTQSNNFKEHKMSHLNENQYYCSICGSGFRHKTHFNTHVKRHDPKTANSLPKKYECNYCDKKMHTKYQKNEHERTHTRERPFLCKECGQQFGTSSTLHRHQFIHSNPTHQCQICLKLFKQKSGLKKHFETHSNHPEKRVVCECGKTFSQRHSLKKHKLICKNRKEPVVKPFGCCVCSKNFLTKSDLKRHLATHNSSKRFTCPVCQTCLKSEETFRKHMRRHDDVRSENTNEVTATSSHL